MIEAPWGDGEMGALFAPTYIKSAEALITGSYDLGEALKVVCEKFGISASKFESTETSNSQ